MIYMPLKDSNLKNRGMDLVKVLVCHPSKERHSNYGCHFRTSRDCCPGSLVEVHDRLGTVGRMGPLESEEALCMLLQSWQSREEVAGLLGFSLNQKTTNRCHRPGQGCACNHPSCRLEQ